MSAGSPRGGASAPLPTAPFAAGTLVVGWAVVAASGSRTLGGVALLIGGVACIAVWKRRHGTRTAAQLAGVGFAAFVLAHVLGLLVGAWPAVLIVAAGAGVATWQLADSRASRPRRGLVFRSASR